MPNPQKQVSQYLQQGKSHEEIYKILLEEGFKVPQIQEALKNVSTSTTDNKVKTSTSFAKSHTISVIVFSGSFLVGLGILSFIAANWQGMSKALKVFLIIFGLISSYSLGWYLIQKTKYKKAGNALIFLGILIFGAGLSLIYQIFNLKTSTSLTYLLWFLGILVLAYALDFAWLYAWLLFAGFSTFFGTLFSSVLPFFSFQANQGIDFLNTLGLALLLFASFGCLYFVNNFSFSLNSFKSSIKEGRGLKRLTIRKELFLLLSFLFFSEFLFNLNSLLGDVFTTHHLVLFLVLLGFFVSYYFNSAIMVFLSLTGFLAWWNYQSYIWFSSPRYDRYTLGTHVGSFILLLLYYVLGRFHQNTIYKRFSQLYVLISLVGVTFSLFVLSTREGLFYLRAFAVNNDSLLSVPPLAFLIFLFSFLLIFVSIYSLSLKRISKYEVLAVITFFIVSWLVLLIFPLIGVPKGGYQFGYSNAPLRELLLFWVILFNILLFLEIIGLIFLGYMRKSVIYINFGAVLLFILIIFKYFDWFFSFLDKSVFFIGAGLLLLGLGAFMEKGRRLVIKEIKNN